MTTKDYLQLVSEYIKSDRGRVIVVCAMTNPIRVLEREACNLSDGDTVPQDLRDRAIQMVRAVEALTAAAGPDYGTFDADGQFVTAEGLLNLARAILAAVEGQDGARGSLTARRVLSS